MPVFTQRGYGRAMAVLQRGTPRVQAPPDFGLGLAVTAVIGGLLLLVLAAASAVPTGGPRGESRQPDPATTYIDISPPNTAGPVLPSR